MSDAFGDLGLIVLDSSKELGEKIDNKLKSKRSSMNSFKISVSDLRFSNGEGKVVLNETVRGKDVYILADVGNYSMTYNMHGFENHLGPDEHFQTIKRTVSAIAGNARRVNVIMHLLYSSRQHKRKKRESLDCAVALQELIALGVNNIITVDAHDARVENAIPLRGFENLHPTYEMIKSIIKTENMWDSNPLNLKVISPDTGAMDRAIYYATTLSVEVGLFYKRRDHSRVVNGKNPIIEHVYLGGDIEGSDILIVDDMLSSGESLLDIMYECKRRKAKDIYAAVSFAFFADGIDKFEKAYQDGVLKKIFTTNLSYIPKELCKVDWLEVVDLSGLLGEIIDRLNYDKSLSPLFDATMQLNDIGLMKGKIDK